MPFDSLRSMQGERPLPDHDAFVRATRENLIRSQREQFNYAYKERRTEFHVNPFGRIGTGGVEGFEVTPIEKGTVILRRLIERDGKPVTDGDVDRIKVKEERRRAGQAHVHGRRRGHAHVHDGSPREVERPRRDRRQVHAEAGWRALKREKAASRRPSPAAVWVDEAAREVIRVEATAVDTISFGFGLIARLNEGTTVTLHREPIDGSTWLPTSIRFAGEGRALLFRKLNVDQRIEWSEYKKVLNSTP